MPIAGAVADRVRALIPITWDALEQDPRVGDTLLQSAIDVAKANVTGTVIDPTQENTYPILVVDFIAKTAALEIIPTGIDYWMNQSIAYNAVGTNDSATYVDRAARIDVLRGEYLQETRLKWTMVAKMVGYWIDNGRAVPHLSSP